MIFSINASMNFLETTAGKVRRLADGAHPDGGTEGLVQAQPAQNGGLSEKSTGPSLVPVLFTLHWTTLSICLFELFSHLHQSPRCPSVNGAVCEQRGQALFYGASERGGSQVVQPRKSITSTVLGRLRNCAIPSPFCIEPQIQGGAQVGRQLFIWKIID